MQLTDVIKEAQRVMTICNACRYCEGFCAVYPAMELRRTFSEQDLKYLANLDGGGHGCNYPGDRFSMVRRWFHHLVFYGFMLCFAARTIAAIYDYFLQRSAPYPFWSWPVMLGTVGGLALLIGTSGLLYLKR